MGFGLILQKVEEEKKEEGKEAIEPPKEGNEVDKEVQPKQEEQPK